MPNVISNAFSGVSIMRLTTAGFIAATLAGPAQAFTFENGTIWPLAVSIDGSPLQVVQPESVGFLFRGQCPSGCTLTVAVADSTQSQASVRGANGQPPAIPGNGDSATVRARMAGGGISIEIAGGVVGTAPVAPPVVAPIEAGAQPPTLAAPSTPAPAIVTPAPPASATPVTPSEPDAPSGFVPPPPPPTYDGN